VGLHGQTVFHDPRGGRSGVPLSAQIAEPSVVAQALECPVVSNFRMADVLEGGEGAPLVPRFDHHQFAAEKRDRVLLNLGGIANLTRLRPAAKIADVVAFDCGPGNMLLDGLASAIVPGRPSYDAGGALASRGHADEDVAREFLADPFILRRYPKSAGREEFGADYLARFLKRTEGLAVEDRLRTAVAITAGAVAQGIALTGGGNPDEVYVSGGGARNRALLEAIRNALPRCKVATTDALGVPVEAKEAMSFAFLRSNRSPAVRATCPQPRAPEGRSCLAPSRRRPRRVESTPRRAEAPVKALALAVAPLALALAAALSGGCAAPRACAPPRSRLRRPSRARQLPRLSRDRHPQRPRRTNGGRAAPPHRPRGRREAGRGLGLQGVGTGRAGRKEGRTGILGQAPSGRARRSGNDRRIPRGEPEPVGTFGVGDTLVLEPSFGGYSGWSGNWYRGSFRIYASSPAESRW